MFLVNFAFLISMALQHDFNVRQDSTLAGGAARPVLTEDRPFIFISPCRLLAMLCS